MLVWCFKNTNTLLEKGKPASPYSVDALFFFFLLPSAPAVSVKGIFVKHRQARGRRQANGCWGIAPSCALLTSNWPFSIGYWPGCLAGSAGVPDNANEAGGSRALVGSLELRSIHQPHMCFRSNVSLVERKDLLVFRTPWMYCFLSWTGRPFINTLTWSSRCETSVLWSKSRSVIIYQSELCQNARKAGEQQLKAPKCHSRVKLKLSTCKCLCWLCSCFFLFKKKKRKRKWSSTAKNVTVQSLLYFTHAKTAVGTVMLAS